jgi:hypothetical protein
MNPMEFLVFVAAISTGFAYVCRLDLLQFKRHKFKVIMLHIALAACAGSAAVAAWECNISLQSMAGLLSSIAWIWVSLPSWRNGVPSHFTKAEPVKSLQWPEVQR